MIFLELFIKGGILIFSLMVFLWLTSLLVKNSSIVDIFWGLGFVLTAWLYFLLTPEGFFMRKLILVILCTVWGLRLTIHILLRNFGKPEDFRYQKWRNESPSTWWIKSLFKVFLLQGLLMWVISVPLLAAQLPTSVQRMTVFDYLSVILWLVGFFFEAAGDAQLVKFRSDSANKGKVLSTGVWRVTRHPNYFGDATQWWAYYLLAVVNGGWWSIFSPVIMTLFLIKVSGVALLEKSLKVEKPEYAEYIRKTSAFIPWFPKK